MVGKTGLKTSLMDNMRPEHTPRNNFLKIIFLIFSPLSPQDNLSNTMHSQQQQDEKDLSWCTKEDKSLFQQIEDLSNKKSELEMEHAALTGTAEKLTDQVRFVFESFRRL